MVLQTLVPQAREILTLLADEIDYVFGLIQTWRCREAVRSSIGAVVPQTLVPQAWEILTLLAHEMNHDLWLNITLALQGGHAEQQCSSGAADTGAPGPGDLPAAGAGPAQREG